MGKRQTYNLCMLLVSCCCFLPCHPGEAALDLFILPSRAAPDLGDRREGKRVSPGMLNQSRFARYASYSRPNLPVERAVLNRLRNVVAREVLGAGQVGNGAGDFQDAVVGAGAQVQVGHGELEQFERGLVQGAILLELAAAHAGVAGDLGPSLEPLPLAPAGGDKIADDGGLQILELLFG